MNAEEIKAINEDRMGEWTERLTENHATPLLLIGIGHDHQGGAVHVWIPENLPIEVAQAYLKAAVEKLK